jgi:AcrR family transcriptional regulator
MPVLRRGLAMAAKPKQTVGLRERKKAKMMASVQMHALRLFREQGYQATTVEQITEAAEISPSTFFRYFSSKEDVMITDNYDPILLAAFESQDPSLSPLETVRKAMVSAAAEMPLDEMETMRERMELIISVPELRASLLNNLTEMMHLLAQMIAKRWGRNPDDLEIRTFAGAIVGVNISVMFYYANNPGANFAMLLDEALGMLGEGLSL